MTAPVANPQSRLSENPQTQIHRRRAPTAWLSKLGPGLITGASDDDPSGIATYSQVGAQFGFGLLWTLLAAFPLMAAFQEICARVGRVTGQGLATNLRKRYPRPVLYLSLLLISIANVFNLGADIGAMAASLRLLIPGRPIVFIVLFGGVSLISVMLVPYSKYSQYLKWLTVSLFAYFGVLLFVHIPWTTVLRHTLIPAMSVSTGSLMAVMAVLGTSISPYLFFWQASQEVEEVKGHRGEKALRRAPVQAKAQLRRIRIDTFVGMGLSDLTAFFIMLTAASTLHERGVTEVVTCAQAAAALEPIAGRYAAALFVCGIVGTGLLAVPALAASVAYGIGEASGWKTSLEKPPQKAVAFYAAIFTATLAGILLNFLHINPVKALIWAAVLNGVVAAPLMTLIITLASSRKVMGKFAISGYLRCLGWIATLAMMLVCVGLFVTWKR
jgi:NRAMP (natural resistance-associated macrophage protein)-like metal ion transporter